MLQLLIIYVKIYYIWAHALHSLQGKRSKSSFKDRFNERVNHYDFLALHAMWRISKGLICLSTNGNYTHVKILTGKSLEKNHQLSSPPAGIGIT